MGEERRPAGRRRTARCPICGRPRAHRFRPFCSAGCRDRDLLHWLEGRYRLPTAEAGDEEPVERSD